ncbi:hypothetical protein BGW41_006496 [Actinomortierella wolfii]|nr:hypothetical protein BGW41_006496 [Actinomortierella wolfii]
MFLNSVKDWDAFGYYNNLIVAFSISAKEAWSFNLDGKGQPGQSTGHLQLDANAASDCAQIERGYFANLRSKPGQYAMFSFETTRITKVAEFPIKIDGMLKGIVPVPNRNGDAPTWAIAYSDKLNGLQGVELSSSSRSRIIGGAVGGVAAVIVIILAVFFWRRKRNQKKSNKTQAQDGLQSTENNHLSSVDANGIALQAGNSEVKGDGSLLKIEEPPLPPLPHEALSQSQQPQLYPQPQPQPQPYTQPYPHTSPQQYPQQYPQPAPHLDQMYHAYPQPQMYQNSMQQHQQPYPSTAAYTAPTTIPTLAPVPAPAVPASTAAPPAEALQQELQFSNHPRPNVVTTVGGANPLSATNLPTASGP